MLDFYDENNKDHLPSIDDEQLSDEEVLKELKKLKEELKDQVIVLGHHYQQDDIISFADITGDSLQLAKEAAKLSHPYIMFCGVHFMAESADMITSDKQTVILPDMNAGCSMADMANIDEIEKCWKFLTHSTDEKIVPITYINCAANLKAFVGREDGSICTSSNAKEVITWALNKGEKLLFFPDQHLGRNTCSELGIKLEDMVIYDPRYQNGGLTKKQVQKAKVILWYGYCSVHQGFNVNQVKTIKKNDPQRTVIVHPECNYDVFKEAHLAGSTSFIVNTIDQAKAGEKFAIGTEINLVNRLKDKYPHLDITSLSPYQCLCTTMYRIRPRWLLASFRAIKEKKPINIIKVSKEITDLSMKALNRMMEII